jgi:hypothetical protein
MPGSEHCAASKKVYLLFYLFGRWAKTPNFGRSTPSRLFKLLQIFRLCLSAKVLLCGKARPVLTGLALPTTAIAILASAKVPTCWHDLDDQFPSSVHPQRTILYVFWVHSIDPRGGVLQSINDSLSFVTTP